MNNLISFFVQLLPILLWMAFWLWAVNWGKMWAFLAQGAWAPCLLLIFIASLVWAYTAPSSCDCLGFVTLSNFWWQFGSVSSLAALALFSGWLQGYFGWTPEEINLDPPADHGHGVHGHDHDHGHH